MRNNAKNRWWTKDGLLSKVHETITSLLCRWYSCDSSLSVNSWASFGIIDKNDSFIKEQLIAAKAFGMFQSFLAIIGVREWQPGNEYRIVWDRLGSLWGGTPRDWITRLMNASTYTGFVKFVQFRSEVEGDAFSSTVESDTADEQHRQQEVREECREVNHFASAFDTLPDTEVADDPDERQRSYQLPAKSSDHFQSVRDFQYSISALRIVQLSILIIKS